MRVVDSTVVEKKSSGRHGKTKYQKILEAAKKLKPGQSLVLKPPKGEAAEDFRRRLGQAVHYYLNEAGSWRVVETADEKVAIMREEEE